MPNSVEGIVRTLAEGSMEEPTEGFVTKEVTDKVEEIICSDEVVAKTAAALFATEPNAGRYVQTYVERFFRETVSITDKRVGHKVANGLQKAIIAGYLLHKLACEFGEMDAINQWLGLPRGDKTIDELLDDYEKGDTPAETIIEEVKSKDKDYDFSEFF